MKDTCFWYVLVELNEFYRIPPVLSEYDMFWDSYQRFYPKFRVVSDFFSWKNNRFQPKLIYFTYNWQSHSKNTIIQHIQRSLWKIYTFVRFSRRRSRKSKFFRYNTWYFHEGYMFWYVLVDLNECYRISPVSSEYDEFS